MLKRSAVFSLVVVAVAGLACAPVKTVEPVPTPVPTPVAMPGSGPRDEVPAIRQDPRPNARPAPVISDRDALIFDVLDDLITVVPDLDGDLRNDWLLTNRSGTSVHTGGWPSARSTTVEYVRSGSNLRAVVADLNADGVQDLVLSGWSDHVVSVFFGPFDGTAKTLAAGFTVKRDPDGGVSDLFGSFTLVSDLDGDSIADLLITAPSEQEEACSGVRPPLVYKGPLSPGRGSSFDGFRPVRSADDVGRRPDFVLTSEVSDCLGEEAEVLVAANQRQLLLNGQLLRVGQKRVGYSLPLKGPNPPALPASEMLSPSSVRGPKPDVDGDGTEDVEYEDRVAGWIGWIRSSDGHKAYVNVRLMNVQVFHLDLDGDGLSAPLLVRESWNDNRYGNDVTLTRFPSTAVGEVRVWDLAPAKSWFRSGWHAALKSMGDVNGDGSQDFAYGNVLIRRAP